MEMRGEQRHAQTRSANPGGTFSGGSLFGFPLRIHWTWFIAAVFVTWLLAGSYLPSVYPDWSTRQHVGVATVVALLFFASTVAHELGHALMARRLGYPVSGITLFLLGGASGLESEPRRAKHEFLIAVIGPAVSLVLGIGFFAGWLGARAAGVEALHAVFAYLAISNVALALFNMLPGLPLDGGRVLRAAVWGMGKGEVRSMRVAAISGQVTGLALLGWGIASIFFAAPFGGIWTAIIGWFIWSSARSSYGQVVLTKSLEAVAVHQVMERDIPRVAPDVNLRDLAGSHIPQTGSRAFFVAPTAEGDVLGLVTMSDLQARPAASWESTSVYRAMTPRDRLVVAAPDGRALEALALMVRHGVQQLPVFHGREAVGLLTRAGLLRAVELRANGLAAQR